jgi:hypothetical protein
MTIILANGNYIKVHKVLDIGLDRTYVDFTIYQKDGYWRHNEKTSFMDSMYDNVNDYFGSLYRVK